jgi:hypothetical protein
MEIVDEETHRVLAYVDALNRQGVTPHRLSVDEFGDGADRRMARRGGMAAVATLQAMALSVSGTIGPGETYTAYLERLGWVLCSGGGDVTITQIGRGLLKALNAPSMDADSGSVVEVVLDPENPFAYTRAMNSLTTVEDGLLVEPYFRVDQLEDVAQLANITRVLLGPGVKPQERKILAFGLAALDPERPLEVRAATNLHDRYLIPRDGGTVLMLGASLGGIGKKVSTITPVGPEASEALRALHEGLWDEATPIEPRYAEKGEGTAMTVAAPESTPVDD